MIQTGNIFYRPREKQAQADQKRAKFFQPEGDHLTLLAVYEAWKAKNFSGPWCFENFIQSRSLRRAQDVRKQLLSIMDKCGMCWEEFLADKESNHSRILLPRSKERSTGRLQVTRAVHPSMLFQRQPDWIIFHELVMTTKVYMMGSDCA
ncbi:unnamed protein product [Microthlaspi erraticum]|uniref:RNA helicase n=1 Tax=Microthlaspi erraticum TaxID=1685480 RepID=A0A6D2L517_9BRAS|nr:unnamed protein product [Microthlaspi erraticum]